VAPLPHCWACHVPVVAWVLRGGRCRRCGARAPARRPLVEVTSAVLLAAAALRFGLSWALPAFCVLFASLVVVSVVDLDHLIIPSRVVYPTLCVTAPLLGRPQWPPVHGPTWGPRRSVASPASAACSWSTWSPLTAWASATSAWRA